MCFSYSLESKNGAMNYYNQYHNQLHSILFQNYRFLKVLSQSILKNWRRKIQLQYATIIFPTQFFFYEVFITINGCEDHWNQISTNLNSHRYKETEDKTYGLGLKLNIVYDGIKNITSRNYLPFSTKRITNLLC